MYDSGLEKPSKRVYKKPKKSSKGLTMATLMRTWHLNHSSQPIEVRSEKGPMTEKTGATMTVTRKTIQRDGKVN